MKCSKKILALMVSLSIIFTLILSMTLLIKNSRSVGHKRDTSNAINNSESKISYIYETETGNVNGTLDNWVNGEYQDYELDIANSTCNNQTNPSELSWNNDTHSISLDINGKNNKCILYFHKVDKGILLTELIKSLLTSGNEVESGNGYLYLHDSSLTNGAGDNGYRYAGNQPNNYICFGNGSEAYNSGTSNECPLTNKYRIIGLVPVTVGNETKNLVKIIKAEYITAEELGISLTGTLSSSYSNLKRVEDAATAVPGFHWNDTLDNTWKGSSLYNALNDETTGYLKFLYGNNENNWENKIETVKWNVGGWNTYKITPKAMYNGEMTNSGSKGSGTTVEAKVGLMYVHDYGFASKKDNWTSTLYNYDNTNNSNRENNWLFNGVYEWTLSRDSSNSNFAFTVYYAGDVDSSNGVSSNSSGVRPVLYLTSDVKLGGGDGIDGSQSKPYKVS